MNNIEKNPLFPQEFIEGLRDKYDNSLLDLYKKRLEFYGTNDNDEVSIQRVPYLLEKITVTKEMDELRSGVINELVILQGPSGSGKGTIGSVLEKTGIKRMPRYTDREKRPNEKSGIDYYFISSQEFTTKIVNGNFIGQPKETYGERRGIDREIFLKFIKQGKFYFDGSARTSLDLLEGAPDYKFLSVFILPPSFEILKNRLSSRTAEEQISAGDSGVSSGDQLIKRLSESINHLEKAKEIFNGRPLADMFIVNDDYERAAKVIKNLLID